jgi:hypothetical protein
LAAGKRCNAAVTRNSRSDYGSILTRWNRCAPLAPPASVKLVLNAVATIGAVVISIHAPEFNAVREKTR